MQQLILRPLILSDENAFKKAIADFKAVDPWFEFALFYDENIDFRDYVDLLSSQARGERLLENYVPHSYLVGVVGNDIVGRVSFRHRLNEFLMKVNGHIGYGVVPSFRNRGYASQILTQTLAIAKEMGLERVLLTCSDDNLGSIKTIEKNMGVLEAVVIVEGFSEPKRSYWIEL